jgi:hypothetical protein
MPAWFQADPVESGIVSPVVPRSACAAETRGLQRTIGSDDEQGVGPRAGAPVFPLVHADRELNVARRAGARRPADQRSIDIDAGPLSAPTIRRIHLPGWPLRQPKRRSDRPKRSTWGRRPEWHHRGPPGRGARSLPRRLPPRQVVPALPAPQRPASSRSPRWQPIVDGPDPPDPLAARDAHSSGEKCRIVSPR